MMFDNEKRRTERDLIRLKSGWDQYSSIRVDELRQSMPEMDALKAEESFRGDETAEARCLRWRLRGLTIEVAIAKIKAEEAERRRVQDRQRKGRKRG